MAKQFMERAGHVLFKRYLVVTNTVSSGVLMGIGDATTQGLERWAGQGDKHDWARTGRLAVLGCCLGPLNHAWYSFLDRTLQGKAATTVVKKILLDQTFAAPTFAFTFFMGVGTLEGQPLQQSWSEFKSKFWQVYLADWTFWPAAQAVNFYLLPPRYRVIYVASITCVWNSFLSFMKHTDQRTQRMTGVSQTQNASLEDKTSLLVASNQDCNTQTKTRKSSSDADVAT